MKDWKTTLCGAGAAIIPAVLGAIQVNQDNKQGWANVGMAAFMALLGWFSKDKESKGELPPSP